MKMFNRPPKEVPIPDTAISHEQAEVEAYAMKPLLDESIERRDDSQASQRLADPKLHDHPETTSRVWEDRATGGRIRAVLPGRKREERETDAKILKQESEDVLELAEKAADEAGQKVSNYYRKSPDLTQEQLDEAAKKSAEAVVARREALAARLIKGEKTEDDILLDEDWFGKDYHTEPTEVMKVELEGMDSENKSASERAKRPPSLDDDW
ncbi:MAG: hypothetical protein NTV95_01825 [Candidatus Saccharibacteria bacterium]|nr:hypothetical protein [Candidatus Saccharibacteria bacterium]